jgi:tetratricopeptide (TPR) repeat protein
VALDPLAGPPTAQYASVLARLGREAEARVAARRALALDSGNLSVRFNVGYTLLWLGEYRRAAAQFALAPSFEGRLVAAYALAGERDSAAAVTAALERRLRGDSLGRKELVWAYAALGDPGRALDELQQLVARGQGRWIVVRVLSEPFPFWEAVRRDPRFARLRAWVEHW